MTVKKITFGGREMLRTNDLACPVCGKEMILTQTIEEIPHFGKTEIMNYSCNYCNYKSTDMIPLETREAVKQSLLVEGDKVLYTKVVRGSDTTIEIKELDMALEPGARASAFYSNIESILLKFKDKLEQTLRYNQLLLKEETDKEIIAGNIDKLIELIRKLDSYLEGETFTILLDSPKGYGAILSPNIKKI